MSQAQQQTYSCMSVHFAVQAGWHSLEYIALWLGLDFLHHSFGLTASTSPAIVYGELMSVGIAR
jgi:hypothetical protein